MTTLYDFEDSAAVVDWIPVGDVVMGGLSSGRLERTNDGSAAFTGYVSLENNGGFASVRTRRLERDLSAHAGLEVRVRGDGKSYKLNLRNDLVVGVLWSASFETSPNVWERRRLPFDRFVATFRGRDVRTGPSLDLSRIVSFGLMISGGQPGPFRLEIAKLKAY